MFAEDAERCTFLFSSATREPASADMRPEIRPLFTENYRRLNRNCRFFALRAESWFLNHAQPIKERARSLSAAPLKDDCLFVKPLQHVFVFHDNI